MKNYFILFCFLLVAELADAASQNNTTTTKVSGIVVESAKWSSEMNGKNDVYNFGGFETFKTEANYNRTNDGKWDYTFNGYTADGEWVYLNHTIGPIKPDFSIHYKSHWEDWNGWEGDSESDGQVTIVMEKGTITYPPNNATLLNTRTSDVKMMLHTGGTGVIGQQVLVAITATATEQLAGTPWSRDIPQTDITIPDLGRKLGADGWAYNRAVNGATLDVTPTTSAPMYSFTVDGGAHILTILARGNDNNYDLSTNTPEFCVGQLLTFDGYWDSEPPNIVANDTLWHLPGKFVNKATNYPPTCTTYVKDSNLLTNATTQCWYVNQPADACSVREILHFSNGQIVNIAAAGNFTVYRPSVNPIVTNGISGAAIYTNDYPNLLWLDDGPMKFDVFISSKYPGNFGLSQLVKFTSESGLFPFSFNWTYGDYYLDGSEYYDALHKVSETSEIFDTPGQGIESRQNFASYNGDWKDYVRFIPNGGIPVTLGRIDWSWAATADKTIDWSIVSDGVDGPTLHDDDSFPVWSHIRPPADPADQ